MLLSPLVLMLTSKTDFRLSPSGKQRSTSQMANMAIDEFVRRKEAEKRIIDAGLQLIETGEAISAEAVNQWLLDGDVNTDFPKAEVIPQSK